MLREPLAQRNSGSGPDDDVGVDVAPVTMRGTLEMHEWNLPFPLVQIFRQTDVARTALAAATAGEERYTSLVGSPMRPTKLRLLVEIERSPAARMPI